MGCLDVRGGFKSAGIRKERWDVFVGKATRAYAHVYLRRCARSAPREREWSAHAYVFEHSRVFSHAHMCGGGTERKRRVLRRGRMRRCASRGGEDQERELSIHISIHVCVCRFCMGKKRKRDTTLLGHTHPAQGTQTRVCFLLFHLRRRRLTHHKHKQIYIYI